MYVENEVQLSPQREAELIALISESILSRRMQAPAIFALEMYKPMSGMLNSLIFAFYPFLTAVIGLDRYKEAIELFRSPESIEKLLLSLEGKTQDNKA